VVQTLWEKDFLLGHSRSNAEADGGQQTSATESKQFDTMSKCRLTMPLNYSEQPVSKTVQITHKA